MSRATGEATKRANTHQGELQVTVLVLREVLRQHHGERRETQVERYSPVSRLAQWWAAGGLKQGTILVHQISISRYNQSWTGVRCWGRPHKCMLYRRDRKRERRRSHLGVFVEGCCGQNGAEGLHEGGLSRVNMAQDAHIDVQHLHARSSPRVGGKRVEATNSLAHRVVHTCRPLAASGQSRPQNAS